MIILSVLLLFIFGLFCKRIEASRLQLHPQIIEELGYRINTRYQKILARTGAGDIKQVAFRVVNFFKICAVSDSLNSFLQGDNLIIAGHYNNSTEFQTLREMHSAYRNVPACRFNLFVEHLEA